MIVFLNKKLNTLIQNCLYQKYLIYIKPYRSFYYQKVKLFKSHQFFIFIIKMISDQINQEKSNNSISEKQFFSVDYDGSNFNVDPFCLSKSSIRFKDIIGPYMNDVEQLKALCLKIHFNKFTKRNMNNFLKICQNLPTDVQNEELKEICEIAKMFKADKIYNTGILFIQNNIDPNFSIPDSKYESIDAMSIVNKSIQTGLQFIDICLKEEEELYSNQQRRKDEKKKNSVIYSVQVVKHIFRNTIFNFFKGNRILYIAKQHFNEVFIVEGCEINLRNKNHHVGHIVQDGAHKFNTINAFDTKFELKYVDSEIPDQLSISVSFPSHNQIISWMPKSLKYSLDKDHYHLNYHGQYDRKAIMSKKNLILKNDAGHPTFIVRQMDKNLYEFECNHNIDPLIAFIIGLSDIIGPYNDPWSNVNGIID